MHDTGLLAMLCAAVVLAFLFGATARRLGASPIVGYLMAGVAIGPFTPGFVADTELAAQLAEVGVILLMFGVGLKFSLSDLWAVRRVAIPGALVQMASATVIGFLFGRAIGMSAPEAIMLGASLSVASTVVLLRELEQRRLIKTDGGRISVGWLVIEDIAIVLAIVLLPLFARLTHGEAASVDAVAAEFSLTALKIAAFVGLMLVVGVRVFPWLITRVAHLRSRELLSLATLALALGLAFAAFALFEASFALGAFLAGVALNGTRLTHEIAEDSQPLRDTFAVLFFVSVGMLFDPGTLLEAPGTVAVLLAVIVLGKSAAALAITMMFKTPLATGLIVAASLAQIGEFSFVLAGMSVSLNLMSTETYNLVLAAALISIAINPLLFALVQRRSNGFPGLRPEASD